MGTSYCSETVLVCGPECSRFMIGLMLYGLGMHRCWPALSMVLSILHPAITPCGCCGCCCACCRATNFSYSCSVNQLLKQQQQRRR